MECRTLKRRVSAYLDDAVSEKEHREMGQHMSACQSCARESDRSQRIREALRSLPPKSVPSDLALRLRVAASKARLESTRGASLWTRLRDRFELWLQPLMRPVALPAVGGLCSAVFLFSALVPTFSPAFAMSRTPSLWDVPTMLATEPTLKCMAPVDFGDADAVVDLKIDDQGHIVNYIIVSAPGPKAEQLRRTIENKLLFTEFWPATAFGKPITGTIRISFSSPAGIDVKG